MAREFRLPDIGEGLTEAEIVRWHVAVGETVAVDQTIVEVETDKAVVEIPSPFGGVVVRHGGDEGEVLAVGAVLVVIADPDEDAPADDSDAPSEVAPIVGTLTSEAVDLTRPTPATTSGPAARPSALPLVRKLARDLGVELDSIEGTGAGGRITREDVMSAVDAQRVGSSAPPPSPPDVAPLAAGRPEGERRPMSRLRRTIATNMSRSWSEIPHVTTFDQVDAGRLLEVRSALAKRHGTAVPLDALVVAAVVPALRSFPSFNASLDGDDIVLHGSIDIGVAIDTDQGLMVAVIADAGNRDVIGLAAEIVRLAEGAKARTLTPSELTGQTFTVSNIGAVGGGMGTPIVPHGTVGILSVGRAVDTPVARDGQVEIAKQMPLSLSYDHRVIDGGEGRRFMTMLIENIEQPALFLV